MILPFNPFDFANPVNGKDLFAGRLAELDEVRYYLDEMKAAPRPINLALLGPRAAGKTSFLNIIEIDSRTRGYCPVRIDLNESDAQNEVVFFFKLFDAVVSAAFSRGAYGGLSGKTYDTYLDMIYACKIPEDRAFCPFLFPLQYAKSQQIGSERALVSDHSLRHDLIAIYAEVKAPLVLLFDECNVLAENRVLLQKIRNLFMNMAGFMLVLTGTPELFPVIDDVFSPIIRQFKKIEIGAFKDVKETLNCIRRPLETLKGVDPYALIELDENARTVREIHELSGGRPYEVKLICHMLFRRVQQNKALAMMFDFSVLEDVRRELESFQDISKRPIVAQVQRLKEKSLRALGLLCAVDGRLSFEEVWGVSYVFGSTKWTQEALKAELGHLVAIGLIEIRSEDGYKLKFRGDEFDKIYTKYLAKERGVNSPFWLDSVRAFVAGSIRGKVDRGIANFVYEMPAPEGIDLLSAAMLATVDPSTDPLTDNREIFNFAYKLLFQFRQQTVLPMAKALIVLGDTTLQYWFYPSEPQHVGLLPKAIQYIERVVTRSLQSECTVTAEQVQLPIPSDIELDAKIRRTANESFRRRIGEWHTAQLGIQYLANNVHLVTLHADLALRYCGTNSIMCRANVGYLKLVQDDLDGAKRLLEPQNGDDTKGLSLLLSYNCAILRLKQGRNEEACGILDALILHLQGDEQICSCLLVPIGSPGSWSFKELRGDLTLSEITRQALETIRDPVVLSEETVQAR